MVPAVVRMTHGGRMPQYRAGPDLSTAVSYSLLCISSPLPLHRDLAYKKQHMETQSNETSGRNLEGTGMGSKGLPLNYPAIL